ncbi:MAG TPA: GNAT family N-acetyltransferase [Pyrinomonadaceae bacterium]|nr:GNAT family N-acetyltransferase [Pyrinomonadaceae bacterium]
MPNQADINVSWASANAKATSSVITPLSNGKEASILSVLSRPSLTNVIMSGFIRDHGLDSTLNRGCFYACHDEQKNLTGVALLGHTMLFEAFDEGAIEAFAGLARRNASPHLLMGERTTVRQFWDNYAIGAELPRLIHPILFLQRRNPFKTNHVVTGLRLANPNDLEQVVHAHAAMAFETSGVDPLTNDAAGFRERYLRRILKNRVWVLTKRDRLVFKTDITAETADVAYLEGVYVSPEERGNGLGRSCLQAIGCELLQRKKAIYLFTQNEDTRLQSFYFNLGFTIAGHYDLLYF